MSTLILDRACTSSAWGTSRLRKLEGHDVQVHALQIATGTILAMSLCSKSHLSRLPTSLHFGEPYTSAHHHR
eukprot:12908723-Prorocentrum_lima.AAC.1